jgi:hypothetical protein
MGVFCHGKFSGFALVHANGMEKPKSERIKT